ncbi:hypothetical protein [Nostoc sp.]|uniref:hypothetical protein n=1 Tax=Nostoc sp. TaxID=1180 RepID=UPI002FF5FDA6
MGAEGQKKNNNAQYNSWRGCGIATLRAQALRRRWLLSVAVGAASRREVWLLSDLP